MKIQLGEYTQQQIDEYIRLPLGIAETLTSTATSNVSRFPLIGGTVLSGYEMAVQAKAATVFLGNDTALGLAATLLAKSGQRITAYSTSDHSFEYNNFGGTADQNTFFTGMNTLLRGSKVSSTFESRFLSGNDDIAGNSSANILTGGAGNDRISGGGGIDTIDGGTGTDVSVYRELPRSDYLTSRKSDGTVTVATRDGTTDQNVNVENIEFQDGTVATTSISYLPGFTAVPSTASGSVYRFYNSRDKAFFYTTNVEERDMIIRESTDPSYTPANGLWPYFYQGTTYEQAHSSSGSVPVFRFYNAKTGHHFFTTSTSERDLVLKESMDPNYGQPGLWPFNYEGEAFRAFTTATGHRDATPIYRFYSPSLDRHFFTGSSEEAAQIRLTGQWTDEGIGYFGEVSG